MVCDYTMSEIRVLIVADDPLARAGLAALLAGQPTVRVVGQTGSDGDLAAVLAAFLPDVVIWDLGWEPAGHIEPLSRSMDAGAPPTVALLATAAAAGEVRGGRS